MLFNSFEFILFLPAVFLLYWFVFRERRQQNLFLVAASYLFYGWWDWRFLLLIAFTSLCSFLTGIGIERGRHRKALCAANICVNLLVLGVFKYYNFFAGSLGDLWALLFGTHPDWATLNVILPVGISFYTFQALGYSIDVYRRDIRASHDVVAFFAFISFFPQLVAGPIERASNLLPQFSHARAFDYAKAVDGCRQMLWGFAKKIIVADQCAVVVNQYWDSYAQMAGWQVFLLGVLFAFQIYCDFSGYSDIAIGCARLFGFRLMRNFQTPYFAQSIPEFWRRWHISLTGWFRDYVYFPLGGSRCSKGRTVRNICVVWGISGLWHGAAWTYVAWGVYHALLLSVYKLLGVSTKPATDAPATPRRVAGVLLRTLLTFVLVVMGWIIFRAGSLEQALDMWRCIATHLFAHKGTLHGTGKLGWAAAMLLAEWLQRNRQHALDFPEGSRLFSHRAVRYLVYAALLATIAGTSGEVQTFIYFQF
ncbi:MAG: MBOAT family protein [Bacteroidaceae bacterium]|nr:MBOAT family protein [Bacteroidaceae bacterium]